MITIKNLSIDFPIYEKLNRSLKTEIFNSISRSGKLDLNDSYRALDNISLSISKGESVGLIGLNGAGKTTLLRAISGIFTPSEGEVLVDGKISTLLDFSTGFEEHHSGLENIKIRLMFLGLSDEEIKELTPEIIEFCDLGDFIYQPARTYSAGMFMRLAFATSTAVLPEILVADEVVGTGDIQFSQKAEERIEKLLKAGHTSVISSHSPLLLEKYCNRLIWLHHGQVYLDDDTSTVLKNYSEQASFLSR